MKFDADKLTADLKSANQAACDAAVKSNDGGTGNLDSVFLSISRIREPKVLAAIKAAGLYCRGKREWIGMGYMITPTTGGQGDKRAIGVDTMYKHLQAAGWNVTPYHQMD